MADLIGLVKKFPVIRNLDSDEREAQLKQNRRLNVPLFDNLSVVEMNSTYLETTDKWFTLRGMIPLIGLFGICFFGFLLCVIIYTGIFNQILNPEWEDKSGTLWGMIGMCTIGLPTIFFSVWMLRREAFRSTYYPLRFNRQNRMVYVYRLDGTVLSIPWDTVFFNAARGQRTTQQNWDIRGHVFWPDGRTVSETFALGISTVDKSEIPCYWELIRRYMEEGPQAVTDAIPHCMPLGKKRESFLQGWRRLNANLGNPPLWGRLLFAPVYLLNVLPAIGRTFAMYTSRIPQWPKEVEQACQVEAGDPYLKNNDTHPY